MLMTQVLDVYYIKSLIGGFRSTEAWRVVRTMKTVNKNVINQHDNKAFLLSLLIENTEFLVKQTSYNRWSKIEMR